MKYLKMLSIAAIAAAALLAVVGAGSASAAVLCKVGTNTAMCPTGSAYSVGQDVHAEAESTLKLATELVTFECTGSTVMGTVTRQGSTTETAEIELTKEELGLNFSGCNATVKVLSSGKLIIHHKGGTEGTGRGTVTSEGASVKLTFAGVSCTYGTVNNPTDIGTLKSTGDTGGTPTLEVNAKITKEAGGGLCTNPATWTGSYKITTPMEAWVTEG